MLNKIKNLGLSIVIGSMIVVSIPVNVNADDTVLTPAAILSLYELEPGDTITDGYGHVYNHEGKHIGDMVDGKMKPVKQHKTKETKNTELNKAMAIYGTQQKMNKETEKIFNKYFNNKEIKAAAKQFARDEEKRHKSIGQKILTNDIDLFKYVGMDCSEVLVDKYEEFNREEQKVVDYIFNYHFYKNLKTKNTVRMCKKCESMYVNHKDAVMFGYDNNCGCNYKTHRFIKVPKLTLVGLKAACKNSGQNDVKVYEENGYLVTEHEMASFEKCKIYYSKETRTVVNTVIE